MPKRKFNLVGACAALAVRLALAQTAALPASYTGPWRDALPPDGWTFSGLGAPDYNPDYDGINDGAAKLDDTGDFISIHCATAAGAVSFWVKGLSFISSGVFRVEQSSDGTNWAALAVSTNLPTVAERRTLYPNPPARHLRFLRRADHRQYRA